MYTQNQIKRRLSTSTGIENMKQLDGDHGRIETRSVRVTNEIGWLKENHSWYGLQSIVAVTNRCGRRRH